jgi:hypothetical protein
VLISAIRDGLVLTTWQQDSFGYAESFDETSGRYRGLRCGHQVNIQDADAPGLLVKPDVAIKQLNAEMAPIPVVTEEQPTRPDSGRPGEVIEPAEPTAPPRPRRFHGTVTLDPTRMGRDAGRIAEEVVSHLVGLSGAEVKVTLEIDADIPCGASEQIVRTVTENSRTLKFSNQGFEEE